MSADNLHTEYGYDHPGPTWEGEYVWRPVISTIRDELPIGGRIFELGCGNGATAATLSEIGYHVVGVDPSEQGIRIAQAHYPTATFSVGSAYDDLRAIHGQFPVVVSLEVVEHCFWPRKFATTIHDLLEPGGLAIISTPYHGYLKNLALALAGKFDSHFNPLWDGGHIKFWSERTLGILLTEAGFASVRFSRAGRVPWLAKSMIAIARKPARRAS